MFGGVKCEERVLVYDITAEFVKNVIDVIIIWVVQRSTFSEFLFS